MTDPVLPGSGRLATSLSSSSTASFTGPRSGEGGGPRGWLAEDRGLPRRREPPTGPGVDHPGEDAVAHAVRDRGPRQRGSSPSTSLTSTSRTGGAGCAPKRRDPGCSGNRYNRSCYPDCSPAEVRGQVSEEDHSCDQTASDGHDVTSVNAGVSVRGRAMNCVSQRLRGDTADSAGRLIGPQRRSHGGLTGVVRTGGSP
jgi:hypothetical protein